MLFVYKFPLDLFLDPDNDPLFYMVSRTDGDYIPNWLFYEDITRTLSGIPNENSTNT